MEKLPQAFISSDDTLDDLILGNLKLLQSREGYRFSLDAVLLAHFVLLERVETVIDLGTGNGVIPLLLSVRSPASRIIGIDIQDSMVARARKNIEYNKLEDRIEIVQADIRELDKTLPGGCAELVLCNPPFWRKGEGKVSDNKEKATARHELQMELGEVVAAANHALAVGGRFSLIHRAERLPEIMELMKHHGLKIKRLRAVHSQLNREAGLVLAEGQKQGRGGFVLLPPLIIYDHPGQYSPEIQELYIE